MILVNTVNPDATEKNLHVLFFQKSIGQLTV